MEVTPTIIVALITAFAAIIAPVITTYFNNKTQFKLKTIDMFYKEKSEAYQNFCTSTSIFLDDIYSTRKKNDYLKVHQVARLMADNKTRSLLDEFESCLINPTDILNAKKLFQKISKSMNNDLVNNQNLI